MTDVFGTLSEFIDDQLQEFADQKDNLDEWYVIRGDNVGEFSVWADHDLPEDYDEVQEDLPPEDRDADANVPGYVQVGHIGWASDAFEFENGGGFVGAYSFGDDGKLDTRLLNILVVHESVLSGEALEVAGSDATRPEGGDSA